MNSVATNQGNVTVAQLLERRLKELERSSSELAEAAQVPVTYMNDLISGRRRPPLPSRTDIYQRMTSFLKLGRNELESSAQSERKASKDRDAAQAPAPVRRMLLTFCNQETADKLEADRTKAGTKHLNGLLQRLLNVAQMEVRRVLLDPAALRVAAERSQAKSSDVRFSVLEFLDASVATLTTDQVERYVKPRIVEWGMDAEHGALKVVLRSH